MKCLYCVDPDRNSISHIIPELLGRGPVLKRGVCGKCNGDFNRYVEQRVGESFRPLRALLGLETKRGGRRPSMPVIARFGGSEIRVTARNQRDLEARLLRFENVARPDGRRAREAFISADSEALEHVRKKRSAKDQQVDGSEIDPFEIQQGLEYVVEIDYGMLGDDECRRIAAKVALEWWCKQRSVEVCSEGGFREVAEYALAGTGPGRQRIEIVADPAIYAGLGNIPFGCHQLVELMDFKTRRLVVVFGLFGWIYYKVLLDESYALTTSQKLTLVNPQSGRRYSPTLTRGRLGYFERLCRYDYGPQAKEAIFGAIYDSMTAKINSAFSIR